MQRRFAVGARNKFLQGESIFRGEVENRGGRRRTIRIRTRKPKFLGTSIATKGRLTSLMRAYRPHASIASTRNSRISGQASGRSRHHGRHPSLVGARRLRPKMGAENCRDHRATRRTRFSRTKAICGWQRLLPRLPALSGDASATATTKLYA